MKAKLVNEGIKHLGGRSDEEILKGLPKTVVVLQKYLDKKNIAYKLKVKSDDQIDFFIKNGIVIDYHSVEDDFFIWKQTPEYTNMHFSHLTLEKVIELIESEKINESVKHLSGRSEEELERNENLIKEKVKHLILKLNSLGITARIHDLWENYPIYITIYKVFQCKKTIAECYKKEHAEKMLKAHQKYTIFSKCNFSIKQVEWFCDVEQAENIINKMKDVK